MIVGLTVTPVMANLTPRGSSAITNTTSRVVAAMTSPYRLAAGTSAAGAFGGAGSPAPAQAPELDRFYGPSLEEDAPPVALIAAGVVGAVAIAAAVVVVLRKKRR